MNSRGWIYVLLLAIAVIIFLIVPRQVRKSLDQPGPLAPIDQNTNNGQSAMQTRAGAHAPVAPTASARTAVQYDAQKRQDMFRQTVENKNSPIAFYGQVIDQDSNAVEGVDVKAAIRQWVLPSPDVMNEDAKIIHVQKATDARGRVEIDGETGDGFDVESVEKQGYVLSAKAPNHFGPSSGSFENPAIIKMWKLGEKAQLISGSKSWGIIPDGRVYTVDLIQETIAESADAGGDVRVAVKRPTGVARQDHYDWSFEIAPIDGGIVESDGDFMYRAPDNGYLPAYDFQLHTLDTNWTDRVRTDMYIRSKSGKYYGSMRIEIFAHYQNEGRLKMDWSLNPDGSRNLQP